MLSFEIPFDTNTIMKEILQDLADDHTKSLENLKDIADRVGLPWAIQLILCKIFRGGNILW